MRKGFIFRYELCVGCRACSAACMLENEWNFRSRNIYSSNNGCHTPSPVVNLSMACNHCHDPACMNGCPSGAYSKMEESGAVVIDPQKCLGCGYCTWNCPYDAPKINAETGIIEKCHFCFHLITGDGEPACSSSCPTGALAFGEIPEKIRNSDYSWMPEKELNPSMMINGSMRYSGPVIIPEKTSPAVTASEKISNRFSREWSLIGFTFLAILSVAINTAAIFSERIINSSLSLALVVFAGIFSLFHLRSWANAWRAASNLSKSPLSREIAIYLLYSVLLFISLFTEIPHSSIIVAITGILLILGIDSVYVYSVGKGTFSIHSGQALPTVMLIISFLLDAVTPFIFLAVIKTVLTLMQLTKRKDIDSFVLRFLRLALLFITAMAMVLGTDSVTSVVLFLFIAGELLDRISFYSDFTPLNIIATIDR